MFFSQPLTRLLNPVTTRGNLEVIITFKKQRELWNIIKSFFWNFVFSGSNFLGNTGKLYLLYGLYDSSAQDNISAFWLKRTVLSKEIITKPVSPLITRPVLFFLSRCISVIRLILIFCLIFFVERRNSMGLTDDEIVNVSNTRHLRSCNYCLTAMPSPLKRKTFCKKNDFQSDFWGSCFVTLHSFSLLRDSKKRISFYLYPRSSAHGFAVSDWPVNAATHFTRPASRPNF